MNFNSKQMAGVPVLTRSGRSLGKAASFDFDRATGRLAAMRVKTRGLVPGLLADELVIPWAAIVEVTEKQITVQDAAIPDAALALAV